MNEKYKQLICAVDTDNVKQAADLACYIKDKVGAIKLGLEFFTANGPAGVREIQKYEIPIFLDLKLHDIPNTVAAAVRGAVKLGAFMLTVHTLGGNDMMRAAKEAAEETASKTGRKKPIVLGVTILTSLDDKDVKQLGMGTNAKSQVLKLAGLARESGLDGVVCSSYELTKLRKEHGPDFKLVVPGIRPTFAASDDQKRVMTPAEAIKNGADYLVIGRPITKAANPMEATERIADEVQAARKVASK